MSADNTPLEICLDARSAKEFATMWEVPERDVLFNGSVRFPNMHQRQDRLVGQVLDACVILHVYERMKDKVPFSKLRTCFNSISSQEFQGLENDSDDQRLKRLIEMAHTGGHASKLKTHYSLVDDKEWEKFQEEFRQYRHAKEIYNNARGDEARSLPKPKMPKDPRVGKINAIVGSTIQVLNPGPKEPARIEEKAAGRGIAVCAIRDVNRIGVLPTTPEFARDFITIMTLLNPPKELPQDGTGAGKKKISRIFVESPEVLANGYYNQKMFLALDRDLSSKSKTHDHTAAIAEVKIVPAGMLRAEELSAAIKPLIEALAQPSKYTSSITQNNKDDILSLRDELKSSYLKKSIDFDRLLTTHMRADRKFKPKYEFPDFPKDKALGRPDAYSNLREALFTLSTRIVEDGIKNESPAWQEEYVRTVLFQRLVVDEPGFSAKAAAVLGRDFQHTQTPDNSFITRIAKLLNFNIDKMATQIKTDISNQYNAMKTREAEQKRSRS